MNKILVFGYDLYHPGGGVNDLIAVITSNNALTSAMGIKPAVLEAAIEKSVGLRDRYQVLHFGEEGEPLYYETWSYECIPGLESKLSHPTADGRTLYQLEFATEFPNVAILN